MSTRVAPAASGGTIARDARKRRRSDGRFVRECEAEAILDGSVLDAAVAAVVQQRPHRQGVARFSGGRHHHVGAFAGRDQQDIARNGLREQAAVSADPEKWLSIEIEEGEPALRRVDDPPSL
jgi:hypothetical protein